MNNKFKLNKKEIQIDNFYLKELTKKESQTLIGGQSGWYYMGVVWGFITGLKLEGTNKACIKGY